MSSGLPAIPDAARTIVRRMAPQAMRRIESLGMTPRQQELNFFWSWYACCRYDARKVDWDGSERVDRVDGEAIATAGVLPGGFYDAGVDFPLKFRRPSAPYNLPRVITNRFTGLLFSESQHPRIRVTGDPDLEDYVGALADSARLWAAMIQARTFGGATGTFCLSFKFVDGKPVIEVHDPRWVTPSFKNLDALELKSIDKRWMWPDYQLNDKGEYDQVWYWTRRVIDEDVDVVWNKVPVGNGDEPDWERYKTDQAIRHGFGFCPAVWGQNSPVCDSEDGEPDCIGVYDMIEEMDALIAQPGMALKKNLDPTVVINSDLKLAELRKGSDNAVKLEKGGDAKYMEGSFEGPVKGMEHAMKLRELVLEVAQCVLDNEDAAAPETATKSRMRYASMTSRADVFREQYGQKGVLPLVDKMLRAIRALGRARPGAAPNGGPLRQIVVLPPREMTEKDGSKSYQPRELPPESDDRGALALQWPPYFPPSLQDAQSAANAVKAAKDAGAIDDEHAARFLAPYFGIDDVPAMLLKVKAEQKERQEQAEAQARQAFAGAGGGGF